MADSSRNVMRNSYSDRISALPDSTLHEILSFLDMKRVVETSLLSKRWRNVWRLVPVLNLSESMWRNNNRLLTHKFVKFIHQILSLDSTSDIVIIRIHCLSWRAFDRVGEWVKMAARKRLQELHITIQRIARRSESRELSGIIFSSGLRVFDFKLTALGIHEVEIQLPISISMAPNLKTIVLSYTKFPQGDSKGEFVLSCPLLENLELIRCEQEHLSVLDISTPQLKKLVIGNLTCGPFTGLWNCGIKIFTPKLETFELSGLWYSNYTIGDLSFLFKAKVNFAPHIPNQDDMSFVKVLEAVSYATDIQLTGNLQVPQNMSSRSVPFSNLRSLMLKGVYADRSDTRRTMLELLKFSPCIETLCLEVNSIENFGQELYLFNFQNLKSLEMSRVRSGEFEIEFLEFLLKKGVLLEELRLEIACLLPKRNRKFFVQKIRSLARDSSIRRVIIE